MKIAFVCFGILLLCSCVKGRGFNDAQKNCIPKISPNTDFRFVKDLYVDKTIEIQQNLIIEGYVISSDKAGNFFNVLHFQDDPIAPTQGFQIAIDVRDSHLFYPVGSKLSIKLKGLFLGKSKGVFKLGGVFTSFGNQSVGRLPAAIVDKHIFVSCDGAAEIVPNGVSIGSLDATYINTLVRLTDVEIPKEEIHESFAVEKEETKRTLIDCSDNELILLNSGFSDFRSEILPQGKGDITGVLLRENDKYQLVVRNLADIDLDQERCEDIVDKFTSTHIFMSEIADPNNNTGARFVELYNAGIKELSLKGWRLNRYTNANTDVSATTELTEITIEAKKTIVISPNAAEFELVYGFAPDLAVGANSPADSNGDDNLELVDPFGTVIDVFGIVGEDGTGTNHEFEDGRAVRNLDITRGNQKYTFSEWTVYNDTGNSATINLPQNAPEDFSPGNRE